MDTQTGILFVDGSSKNLRKCLSCGREKLKTDFYSHRKGRDGLYSYCKLCVKLKKERWRSTQIRVDGPQIEQKSCIRCGHLKPADDFYFYRHHKDGLSHLCKECTRKDLKAARSRRKYTRRVIPSENICRICGLLLPAKCFGKNVMMENGLENRCHDCMRKMRRKYESSIEGRIHQMIKRAKRRHLESRKSALRKWSFPDLTAQSVLAIYEKQNGLCAVTGIKMRLEFSDLYSPEYYETISLDRIDNKKGYEIGNVQLVCLWANVARQNLSIEEFRRFVRLCQFCEPEAALNHVA